MNKALVKNLPYEPLRDFVPLGYISAYPFALVVRSDLPTASLREFIAYAKERPGKLTYGSPGLGTLQHTWGTILLKSLGLDLVHVPTLKESGVDFVGESWFAMFVLAIAPGEQAKFLQDEIERWGTLVTRYGVGVD